jgi:hypothetical protein
MQIWTGCIEGCSGKNRAEVKIFLAMKIELDINGGGESQGSISRSCEEDRDALAGPVFGRFFHPALRGHRTEHKFLRRSGLDGPADWNGRPAMERAKRDDMERYQRCFSERERNDLFPGPESRWRDTAIQAMVCAMQANGLRTEQTNAGWLQFL